MKNFASLRYRLLALVLIPIILLGGTVMLFAYHWSSNYTYQQLFAKVNTDLSVASDAFSGIEGKVQQQLLAFADSSQLDSVLENLSATGLSNEGREANVDAINSLLERQTQQSGFNYLNLLSGDATLVMGKHGWQTHELARTSLVSKMLAFDGKASYSGIEILEMQDWMQQAELDAEHIELPILFTARAKPTPRKTETRAMIIRALQSIYDKNGQRLAIVEAGLLLNRNFEFVDRIRDLVYGPGSLTSGSLGTVTVFLEDTRITTNVMLDDGSRALGTRVSSAVRDAVLDRGETWIDRAFVVNDWYISAYEPIVDTTGVRVGMLYAGYLEKPYRQQLLKAFAVLSALVVTGSLAAAVAAVVGARSIFSPIENMSSVVRATARGEHKRIGPISTGDEIGELAFQFDAMLDTLAQHRQQIERAAEQLELKVQLRTEELEQQNQRLHDSIELLQQTKRRLAGAEKLAALGEFTAGVAHEINNPTAVILGNMDVLVTDLGDSASEYATETDLIFEQVYRIRAIVDSLLQYSRSAQRSHTMSTVPDILGLTHLSKQFPVSASLQLDDAAGLPQTQVEELINDTLKLLVHELRGRNIDVVVDNRTDLYALIETQELQQVLVNLISNSIQAIENDGKITITSCNQGQKEILLQVEDSGAGIQPEHLDRVFDPFFTTGKATGTGLGLSVSYSIIRRHGGDIVVSSELCKGSIFSLTLPAVRINQTGTLRSVT